MSVYPCPEAGCSVAEPFVAELAGHLMEAHGVERSDAIARAKACTPRAEDMHASDPEPTPPAPKEPTMPTKPCCGSKGPRHKRDCPEHGSARPKKAAKGRAPSVRNTGRPVRKSERAEPAAASNGHAVNVGDNAAKKAGAEFLAHLVRLRDRLDGDIARVSDLVSVL